MSRRQEKPTDPDAHLGVYKRLEDVKDRHRLDRFEAVYAGRDVWEEWLQVNGRPESKTQRDRYNRTKATWIDHMTKQRRHHAIPTPKHVEGYAEWLLEDRGLGTVLRDYWPSFTNFFEWILWSEQHEHRYNPVTMAARNYDTTRVIWDAHRVFVSNGGILPNDYEP